MKYHLLLEYGQYGGYFDTVGDLCETLFDILSKRNRRDREIGYDPDPLEYTILISYADKLYLDVLLHSKVNEYSNKLEVLADLRNRVFDLRYSEEAESF